MVILHIIPITKPLYDVFKYADYDNHNNSVIQDFSVIDIIKGR